MKLKVMIFCLCSVFVLGVLNLKAFTQKKEKEVFTCNALVTTAPASGKTTRFTINIDEYTSDEDNLKYLNLLKTEGQKGLRKVLEKVSIGWIAPRAKTREMLNFARSHDVEGGRVINILKTRHINFMEMYVHTPRSREYDMTYIQLKIDENGEGEGYMFAGTKVEINSENKLVLEQRTTAPIRLQHVKLRK